MHLRTMVDQKPRMVIKEPDSCLRFYVPTKMQLSESLLVKNDNIELRWWDNRSKDRFAEWLGVSESPYVRCRPLLGSKRSWLFSSRPLRCTKQMQIRLDGNLVSPMQQLQRHAL